MLMARENMEVESINSNVEEADTNLEGGLVNVIKEIEILRKKNKTVKYILIK